MTRPTRRDVLTQTAALVGVLGTAGCSGLFATDLTLMGHRLEDGLLEYARDPLAIRSQFTPDYSDAYKHETAEELVETGTVSTRAWELCYRSDWGTEPRDRRRCLLYDGTYYRVRVEDVEERVPREQWAVYLDWRADPPGADDEVATLPLETLSDQDRRILTRLVERLAPPGRRGDPHDLDWAAFYHDDLDAEASDLVPEPPFDYLETDDETFAVRTKRVTDERKEQTFSVEAVADSREAYLDYARSTFPDGEIDESSLSTEARQLLQTVTEGYGGIHKETAPLSDELEAVVEQVGIGEALQPLDAYGDRTPFRNALAEYGGDWYEFDLIVAP